MNKPNIVIVHGAICGGCDVALANSEEAISKILENIDLAYWSVAVDSRLSDLKSLGKIDVAVFMGGVRTSEDEELAKWLREKSKILVAFGSCSAYGGIPGLAALTSPIELINLVKSTITTSSQYKSIIELPKLPELSTYRALPHVVNVDIVVPGCPPPIKVVNEFVNVLLKYIAGEEPIGPLVIAGSKAQCETCPRKPKDLSKLHIPSIKRIYEAKIEENRCFLEQGILCLGPVTREGCEHSCINVNMPCTGCFGPLPGFEDVGLRYIAGILALVAVEREKELMEQGLAKILDKLVDRLGVLYRYTLPRSRLYMLKLSLEGSEYAR